MYPGLIIAAPCSGSGKTTITLGLLRLLFEKGLKPKPYKTGPDYIDTHYHSLASQCECHNLDPWAMRSTLINQLISHEGSNRVHIVEGVMGLYDGVTVNAGSTADLAKHTGWPVILVIDASRQSHSIAALAKGFCEFRKDITISGLILNRVGSEKHRQMLLSALAPLNIPVLGTVPRSQKLERPSRHLGLHQAAEHSQIESFINQAAALLNQHIDLTLLKNLCTDITCPDHNANTGLMTVPPLGKHIAIAKDTAFSFIYQHFITSWSAKHCELSYFSPLNDERPHADCDAVFLPGGYPELHLENLSQSQQFKSALICAAEKGKTIYAECGGHMVLGQSILGEDEKHYPMVGLLPHTTSFKQPKMTLGYRQLKLGSNSVLGHAQTVYKGHEFHYSSELAQPHDDPLFIMTTATGEAKTTTGYHHRNLLSSFIHLIDIADN